MSSDENKLTAFDKDDDFEVSFKPMSGGLGFKDRVGQVTQQIESDVEEFTADAGTFELSPTSEVDDGKVEISEEGGVLKIETPLAPQPFLRHSGHDGLVKKTPKKSPVSLMSTVIDMLALVSLSILALAIMSFAGLAGELVDPSRLSFNKGFLESFGFLSAIYLCYHVGLRILWGRTLGEWACRLQLALKKDQKKSSYPILVLFRELCFLGTGILLVPILSSLAGKDFGFYFSGLHTYQEEI